MATYLDSSALVKLVVAEPETGALRAWLSTAPDPLVSSELARLEVLRSTRRVHPDRAVAARSVVDGLALHRITADVLDRAALLEPDDLPSLDAIHLATALALGSDLEAFVSYDQRQLEAAELLGLATATPT